MESIFLSSFKFALSLSLLLHSPSFSSAQIMQGFVSLDCGGTEKFTDELGLHWTPDDKLTYGQISTISVANETRKQYTTLRHFPADSRKYCYTLEVVSRTRYLLRASFLYGNFDNNNVYPKFDISVGATHWSTIVISDANSVEMRELIFLASSPTVSVCLSNATTGQPFISTLELRQFNGSVYYTQFEQHFYLSVSARINFGAESDAPIRYPDDPFDRIWESDSVKKANYLVDVAAGTEKISTTVPIDVNRDEMPPVKVMQTAVVGTNGSLTYRLNLDGFPGTGWAFTYFAEIEDLDPDESRKFRLVLPGQPDISKAVVNIEENAQGKYRLYEPGFTNISLPFVLSFRFGKTYDSSRGPLLNAMEINMYLEKNDGSLDGATISNILSHYSAADWLQEGGDPCLPVPWSWVRCNSDPQPRIVSILLSNKNLTGNIPLDITKLVGLVELWLDGNMLTGPFPDFTGCMDLKIIHLENNQLTGVLPTSLTNLPSLRELYVQNNMLSGTIPSELLSKDLVLNYSGNINLHRESRIKGHMYVIIGSSVGASVLLLATIISCLYMHKGKRRYHEQGCIDSLPTQRLASWKSDDPAEAAHCFSYSEIENATNNFEKKIGSGGFGVVYYGKLKDGKEIAVKVLTSPLVHGRSINWIKRLEIAEDAAKGIEYLHTGCVPVVIHRDLKSSNILLDKHMRAKVSDFGLSKLAVDGVSHVSSIVRGTAKLHIESGDIQGIIDPLLRNDYDLQSMWKIAEKALMCVQPHGHMRPSISEALKEIQDAISIERQAEALREGNSDDMSKNSFHSSMNMGSMDLGGAESYLSIDESIAQPTAR
ncbi:hypothetical protein JHK87_053859 [Glycine soja]|nr:hypothetical protein JHK87_053859 [Glycine soja]